MIDAQAVLAQVEELRNLESREQGASRLGELDWLEEHLQRLSMEHHQDDAGNYWIILPGESERAIVLGSYSEVNPRIDRMDGLVGVVAGLETIKALAHRFEGRPPCTLQLVVWAEPGQSGHSMPAPPAFVRQNVAAYLELHIAAGQPLEGAGTPGSVVTPASADETVAFNPRLMMLCDEAIRELTGAPACMYSEPALRAVRVAQMGIPTAMMYVQALTGSADEGMSSATRLNILKAAEAFGRWVESTMHLVAGNEVDLWALEHRLPHS